MKTDLTPEVDLRLLGVNGRESESVTPIEQDSHRQTNFSSCCNGSSRFLNCFIKILKFPVVILSHSFFSSRSRSGHVVGLDVFEEYRIKMDWPTITLDWVNCLRLTENPLKAITELGDGKFLCEVLQILFRKTVNIKNKAQVFHVLKQCLIDLYTPSNWINFEDAYEGNAEELVKIVSVLIGVSSLQSEEKLFLENPSNYLSIESQVHLTKFLESVLENGKTIDAGFISNMEDKENEEDFGPVSYSKMTLGGKDVAPKSPLSDAERRLRSENVHEISTLKNRIEVLTACQRDLMDDINSYKEESAKANQRCEELEKENQSLKLNGNLNRTFTVGSPNPETPENTRNTAKSLRERLNRSENYVDVLETKIDEGGNKIRKLEEELAALKKHLQEASFREAEMMKELEKDEHEKINLRYEIDSKDEIVRKLTQEIEDYRDTQQMNLSPSYENDHGTSGIVGLSICDNFIASSSCEPDGVAVSTCEDMASAVVEVQLREIQTRLNDSEEQLRATAAKLKEAEEQLTDTTSKLKDTEEQLQDTLSKLSDLEEQLKDTETRSVNESEQQLVLFQPNQKIPLHKGESCRIDLIILMYFFCFLVYYFSPSIVPVLTETLEGIFFGNDGLQHLMSEKHGELHHINTPMI